MDKSRGWAAVALAALLTWAGCDQEQARVEIRTGDQVSQGERARGRSQRALTEVRVRGGQDGVETIFTLAPLGYVHSPVYDGVVLQATDVQWLGDRIFASYNVAGDRFLGALQVIDASDPSAPVVLAEAIYPQTDLARIRVRGSAILAAGADADLGGVLEVFRWGVGGLVYERSLEMGSYAATYLDLDGYRAAVSYGDREGGIALLDLRDGEPRLEGRVGIEDARWVGLWGEDRAVAVSGEPGALHVLEGLEAGPPDIGASAQIAGRSVGAPTWATRRGEVLYISSDDAGMLVYDLRDLSEIGRLPTTGTANGSALTLDGRLALLANGEEGLVLADVVDPGDPIARATFDLRGNIEDCGSANAVDIQGELIALADGLGGVKILGLTREVEAEPNDCDADGVADAEDGDDDDDGVLDEQDAAPCAPGVVCGPGQMDVAGRFVGDFFNLPCDHPEVEGLVTGVVRGDLPWNHDWYDDQYYAFSVERDDLLISYSDEYFPVDQGLCGDPYHFAVHWYTTAIASEAGVYAFEMGSDDDAWLFIDGELIVDLGGIHALVRERAEVELSAGPHRLDLYFAERHVVKSGLEFQVVGLPSQEARLELQQHTCLEPGEDTDGDGVPNDKDVAPLERPDVPKKPKAPKKK